MCQSWAKMQCVPVIYYCTTVRRTYCTVEGGNLWYEFTGGSLFLGRKNFLSTQLWPFFSLAIFGKSIGWTKTTSTFGACFEAYTKQIEMPLLHQKLEPESGEDQKNGPNRQHETKLLYKWKLIIIITDNNWLIQKTYLLTLLTKFLILMTISPLKIVFPTSAHAACYINNKYGRGCEKRL